GGPDEKAQDRAAHATIARGKRRLLAPRQSLVTVVVAVRSERTGIAARAFRKTDRRADVHERVMPPRRFASRAEPRVERDRFAIGGGAAEQRATENAADVRGGQGRRRTERQTG